MKTKFLPLAAAILLHAHTALAHFGAIIPSTEVVDSHGPRRLSLVFQFFHPFEQKWMDLEGVERAGYVVRGEDHSLKGRLMPATSHGHKTWKATVEVTRPGDYLFYMVPKPYWEPSERIYIQHVTKTVVNAYGLEEGWDRPLGLPAEIVPTVRPYGLWTGNLFCGQILVRGKPAANTAVEVEYLNENGIEPPADPFMTQVLLSDEEGRFCYAMPRSGWWGFAALIDEEDAMKRDGKKVGLELGAVIWVRTRGMK